MYFQDSEVKRHDRFIEAKVHFCKLNIDKINILGDRCS